MPKATLRSDKALQQGFGVQSGKVKVLDARFKILQRVKGDGSLVTPMCVLQLDVTKCDAGGSVINEDDIDQKDLIYCWGSKEKGEDGLHHFAFHPAIARNADDPDPDDQGAEIDSEGNSLVPTGNSSAPFADAEAILFTKALELKGWKPEVNDQCYAPNYIGAVFDVETVTKTAFCKMIGIKYTPKEGRAESSDTVWNVLKIDVFPYESSKGASTSKKGVKSTSTTTTSPSKGNGVAEPGAEDLAISTVKKVAESKDFKGKEGIARSKFQAAVMTQLHRDKKQKEQGAVMKLVKDDDWIINAGGDLGFIVDADEGVMNFLSE